MGEDFDILLDAHGSPFPELGLEFAWRRIAPGSWRSRFRWGLWKPCWRCPAKPYPHRHGGEAVCAVR